MPRSIAMSAMALTIMIGSACSDAARTPVEPRAVALSKGGATSNPRATFTYLDIVPGATGGGLTGDGRGARGGAGDGSGAVYDDGLCGVAAQIFASGSKDATMDPVMSRATSKNCDSTVPRALTVSYGTALNDASLAPNPTTAGHYTNVRGILNVSTDATRRFRLMLRGTRACYHLRYGRAAGADDSGEGADDAWQGHVSRPIKVTRISAKEWIAESQPNEAGQHLALCERDPDNVVIAAYDVPFRIRVVQK